MEGPVVAPCEAEVLLQGYEPDLRELRLHHFGRTVSGSVVGHNDLCVKAFAGFNEPRQELPEVVPGVVVQYDNCGFKH